jgi:hypothetical protein
MDELIKSIENFRVSNDSEKFDADLDDVITKLNQQDLLHDPQFEWELLCSNYSKLKYLNDIIKHYYIPESDNFFRSLIKCMDNIDKTTNRYIAEFDWDHEKKHNRDAPEILLYLTRSTTEKDPIDRMHFCLKAYKKLIALVEFYRSEKYVGSLDKDFVQEFNFKRRKM